MKCHAADAPGTTARRVAPTPGDVREVFVRQLALPRGESRDRVDVDNRSYRLRASEVRTLAVVGAFRVTPRERSGRSRRVARRS